LVDRVIAKAVPPTRTVSPRVATFTVPPGWWLPLLEAFARG